MTWKNIDHKSGSVSDKLQSKSNYEQQNQAMGDILIWGSVAAKRRFEELSSRQLKKHKLPLLL